MSTLTFTGLGGSSEIGANSYLVEAEGGRFLLDCGLHPKHEGHDALPDLDLIGESPDALIVTHAHIDHCGAVPYFAKRHPETECYATVPTVRIMDRMMHNSVSVMGTLALERGIKEYPLYTHSDADAIVRRAYGMEFNEPFAPTLDSDVRISFHRAGHVLGAASTLIRWPGHTLLYTGDVCMTDQELLPGLEPLDESIQIDTLMIEATRGSTPNTNDTTLNAEMERFGKAISEVLENRGTVLVPSFALGRTQEVLNMIYRMKGLGMLPDVPVYASGLGRAVYEVYNRFTHYLRDEAYLCPLREFKRIGDVWEQKVAQDLVRYPSIIVATSGMMIENTPSAMIAQQMVKEKRHGIFFVGYLDSETLGYKLLHGDVGDELQFELGGRPVEMQLENRQSFNFSAHAPREDLCDLVSRIAPKNVIYVHGDPESVAWMRDNCTGASNSFAPERRDVLTLEA